MGHVDDGLGPDRVPHPVVRGRASGRRSRAALDRFLDWHTAPGARTVLATEQRLTAEVDAARRPAGPAQRVRRPARARRGRPGRGRRPEDRASTRPPTRTCPSNPQLGLYQLAVEHGAVDDLVADRVDGPACPAAPSWCSCARRWPAAAKVQQQDPQEPDADGHRAVEVQLMRAAEVVRGEEFDAHAGQALRPLRRSTPICPDQGRRDGAVVTVDAIDDPRGAARPDGRDLHAQRPAVGRDHRAAGARGGDRRRRVGQDHGDGGPGGLAGGDRAGRAPTRCSG